MGISLDWIARPSWRRQRGFSLLEQLIAAGLIVTGSICVLETVAFCLITLQASEKKWQEDLDLWNEAQVEFSEQGEINETIEEKEDDTSL